MNDNAMNVVVDTPVTGPAARIGKQSHISIRSPLRDLRSPHKDNNARPVPPLDLSLSVPTQSIAATSRLSQLSARMDSDYVRGGDAMKERANQMAAKMRAVGGKIEKTKKAEDDRLKPLYHLLERSGEDLQREGELIQMIDQRLDEELRDMRARQGNEIEWLLQNRGEAKARLNSQIATACELLTKEFMDDKAWARRMGNERWDSTINQVAAVIDNLEAERNYRQRGEARIYETVNQKMEASNEPIVEESKHREQLEAMFDGKIEEEALKFQLEMQEDKKQRHENSKHTMKMFRDAMTKLAEHVDNEATERETAECDLQDKLLQSIGQLSNCIYQEGKVRVESETQMTKLLEDMALKLHDELAREKDDRQNTERVLMGLLDESVEAIALRANNETLGVLQQRRDERERSRAVREDAAANSKDYWTQKFQEEKDAAKQRHMMELEEEKREEAEQLKAVQDLETTLEGT